MAEHEPAIPAPTEVQHRHTVSYLWTRPRRMGWPTIDKPAIGRRPSPMAPHTIVITVAWRDDWPHQIERIIMRGRWVQTGQEIGNMHLSHNDATRSGLIAEAPDWVMDMASEALRLSAL
jgi:hypothetical protein